MTGASLPVWQELPRLSRAVMKLHNAIACGTDASSDGWYERHGIVYQLEVGQPLAYYSLWVSLAGSMSAIEVGLDCARILPEMSASVLQALPRPEDRRSAVEWLLMPWLDELEALVGCELKISDVGLHRSPPLNDRLPLVVRLGDGRRAHLVLTGNGLSALSEAFRPAHGALPSWCAVEVAWLFSVRGLSLEEMRSLTRGALLRLKPRELQLSIGPGDIRMTAHWQEDDAAEIEGRVEPAATEWPHWMESPPLVNLDELAFDVDIILATQRMTVAEVGRLRKGAVLPLAPPVDGQRVALMHRGMLFARGQLAYVEDEMVVMVTHTPTTSA